MRSIWIVFALMVGSCATTKHVDWAGVDSQTVKAGTLPSALLEIAKASDKRYCTTLTASREQGSGGRKLFSAIGNKGRIACDDDLLNSVYQSFRKRSGVGSNSNSNSSFERVALSDTYFFDNFFRGIGVERWAPGIKVAVLVTDDRFPDRIHQIISKAADTYHRELQLAYGKLIKVTSLEREKKILEQEKKIADDRKSNCSSYGFKPGTDGHSTCVLKLAMAAELKKQDEAHKAVQRAAYYLKQARSQRLAKEAEEEAQRQRMGQALIGLGSAISSGGMPSRSSTPRPNAPPSSGRYKTCSYRVAGDIVPMTVGRAELCSATKLIGGQTGYLVR